MLIDSENCWAADFLEKGFVVRSAEDQEALMRIRTAVVNLSAEYLGIEKIPDETEFLDTIGEKIEPGTLNKLKRHVTNGLIQSAWFKLAYFSTAKILLREIVGNELVMQKAMGFGILAPGDDSAIIKLHSDVWGSECSPFEVVLWVPLVDCFNTKSIFICPPKKDLKWRSELHRFSKSGVEQLYEEMKPDLIWPNVSFGEVLLFTPTLIHGGRVNEETTTRWSINIRFKSLFSPYAGKKLGEYFEPIMVRPATRIGLEFKYPEGFDEQ